MKTLVRPGKGQTLTPVQSTILGVLTTAPQTWKQVSDALYKAHGSPALMVRETDAAELPAGKVVIGAAGGQKTYRLA